MTTVRAKYANGVLTPLEPLDIEEGKEVTLSIANAKSPAPYAYGTATTMNGDAAGADTPNDSASDAAPPRLTGLAAIVESAKEMQRNMPPGAWDDAPTDLAKNLKHYLYGHPKEEDE